MGWPPVIVELGASKAMERRKRYRSKAIASLVPTHALLLRGYVLPTAVPRPCFLAPHDFMTKSRPKKNSAPSM
jgi:hypothetical protein